MLIAGIPLSRSPVPNTRIPIPGLGYAIVNEQSSHVSSSGAVESVNGIHIYVTQSNNVFGLSAGTQIIVDHADASALSIS